MVENLHRGVLGFGDLISNSFASLKVSLDKFLHFSEFFPPTDIWMGSLIQSPLKIFQIVSQIVFLVDDVKQLSSEIANLEINFW